MKVLRSVLSKSKFIGISKGVKENWGIVACLFLWIFLAANVVIWLKIDCHPLIYDMKSNFLHSFNIFKALSNPTTDSLHQIFGTHSHGGFIFVPLCAAPFYALLGASPDVGVGAVGLVSLAILIFSVFGIGREMKDQKTGVLASFIISTYPAIFGLAVQFMWDLPLTAMTALSVYLLMLTDRFENRKYSLIFGLTVGLGLLTKYSFAVFISGPVLYTIYLSLREDETRNRRFNVLLFCLLATIVASIWFLPNLVGFIGYLLIPYPASLESEILQIYPEIFTLKSAFWYIFALINVQASLFYVLIFLMALPFFLRDRNREKIILLLWIILPFLFFTFIRAKDCRYTMPYLPALALISAIGIGQIKLKTRIRGVKLNFKPIFLTVILLFGTFQFFVTHYNVHWQTYVAAKDLTTSGNVYPITPHNHLSAPPDDRDWKTDEIIDTIVENSQKEKVVIGVVIRCPEVVSVLEYYVVLRNLDYTIEFAGYNVTNHLNDDFIITKDGGCLGPAYEVDIIEENLRLFNEYNEEHHRFELLERIELPDNSYVSIFKKL